ncbi:MAG: HAD family hydrolase [Bacteroidales bacterium]|nr:HAD family hydrolase [Bacteroidales bacterium]
MIRAAFFDIDGTLLSFRTHQVSAGTLRAISKLRQNGTQIFLSTGRPKVLIPPLPFEVDGLITMNGALVLGKRGEHLLSNPIPQTDTEHWIDYAAQHKLCTMLFTADSMIASQINAAGIALRDQLGFTMPPVADIQSLHGIETFQIIALMEANRDGEVSALLPNCRLPRWHPQFTDIVARGNSKARGMEVLCHQVGIAQADTIAFGDGANDIEMLRWAGIGIAMGNASPEVKQAADLVTADADHEGIEQTINQLLS